MPMEYKIAIVCTHAKESAYKELQQIMNIPGFDQKEIIKKMKNIRSVLISFIT